MVARPEEEVRKRRAKVQPRSARVYRKLVVLVGVIAVLLAIGLSPRMAPILSAGIIGITVLLFFWLRNHRPKERPEEKAAPAGGETAREEKVIDFHRIDSEEQEKELVWEKDLGEGAQSANVPEIFSENKGGEQENGKKENEGSLQETVRIIEERLAELEEKLAKLEEKVAGIQEIALTSDGKVDLQKIFSQMDETAEKSAKLQRSYVVNTDIPTP